AAGGGGGASEGGGGGGPEGGGGAGGEGPPPARHDRRGGDRPAGGEREEPPAAANAERLERRIDGDVADAVRDRDRRPDPAADLTLPEDRPTRGVDGREPRVAHVRRHRRLTARGRAAPVVPGDEEALAVVGAVVEHAAVQRAARTHGLAPDDRTRDAVEGPERARLLARGEELPTLSVDRRVEKDGVRPEVEVGTHGAADREDV